MIKKKAENWICLTGLLSCIFYFLHIYLGQKEYIDYHWLKQAVSDLTAVNAKSYVTATKFTSLYGTFACICCLTLSFVIRDLYNNLFRLGIYLFSVMNLFSHVGYTLFPLSGEGFQGHFQDIMHLYVVTSSVVILSITSLILIIIGGYRNNGDKVIGSLGILTFISMLFGTVSVNIFSKEYLGLFERFSIFSVIIFTACLGLFGFQIKIKDKPFK